MKHTETEIALAHKIHRLQEEIAELKYQIIILNSKIQIQRGNEIQLKALIGHQNIHINNIEENNNIIDI
jgi:hypothetical protein